MKRVRMTLRPVGVEVHPVYDLLAGGADYLSDVELVNWNVSAEPAGFLVRAAGDADRFAADLEAIPEVLHQAFIRTGEGTFYVYHTCEKTPLTDAVFDAFSLRSLLVVFPMEYHDDGGATVTVVGPEPDLQAALAALPEEIGVDIEAVGGPAVRGDGVLSRLSERQREALEAGIAVGYYDTPRGATSEDVAEELGCAPSTAATHLRKAESALVTGLLQ
jgi:predicted DNA binding protein